MDISTKVNPGVQFQDTSDPILIICSNQMLGNYWPVDGGLYINIETITNWAVVQNPAKSEDLDQPVHPCINKSLTFYWSVIGIYGYQLSAQWRIRSVRLDTQRSVCVGFTGSPLTGFTISRLYWLSTYWLQSPRLHCNLDTPFQAWSLHYTVGRWQSLFM